MIHPNASRKVDVDAENPTPGNKVVLIGAGDVGMAYASAIVNQGLCDHLAIIDLNEEKVWGEVQDLNHAVPWSGHNTRVTQGTYEDCRDAAVVVNCAGVAQRDGETRLELVGRNVKIFKSIVDEVMDHGFNGIFVVATNPVDVLAYATWKFSGLPSNRVIGSGTVLDTARYRYALGEYFDVSATNVHAYVIGEHGDTELAVTSSASAAGIPLKDRLEKLAETDADTSSKMEEIFVKTRDAAYDIIRAKGSTSYGIGGGLARITRAVLKNEGAVLPVSALLEGQYGEENIYIGTPAVINRNGIQEVVELSLDEHESEQFAHSSKVLRDVMNQAELTD
ncbi:MULTISPECIES: L-lactate dehydrogenase [unclassified Corynebacterium]|uniref:L-lactate dehydrogenase n=1 Tax=unclassified Corynebacterium TaxID=2624378 RepID=UPI0021A9B447|nr:MULTISPECIES: L-lactate dehydrogenase [unclassified Corynebacterium]MCT1453387.1 L-lactate dehydrogenase [Corynebacterium sp. p3-SID1145]MCT1462481.1 L-lactate dehydrogenase [Corynebacterium sp. p3-SID1140]MDN8593988.1 L-lactate dehydrogenase [Corynebacterium sp. P4_F2]WKK54879.1 L-lactate dehydrogenase [Corynebacterium sp. P4-C1]WKK64269.1 L-lactate dehydrogenase [Corynebacterium sp. P8-C1]